LFPSSPELDESEQLVLSQKLCLGYGAQPPLYTWLQAGFFCILGPSLLGLSLLKNLLLFGAYAFAYLNARLITRDHACAAVSALSLFFLPAVAWGSQRDLTHSVLASTMASATLFCLLRLYQTRQFRWCLFLGIAAGAGWLSKYTYGIWLVGLCLAAFSVGGIRRAIGDRRMVVALTIAAVAFLPHALWVLGHQDLAFSAISKFRIRDASPWLETAGLGMGVMAVAVVSFLGPLGLIYALVFLTAKNGRTAPPDQFPEAERLVWRALIAGLAVTMLIVLGAHATKVKARWLQPGLICLPIAAVATLRRRITPVSLNRFGLIAGVVMVVVLASMPARTIFAGLFKRDVEANFPYRRLADQIAPTINDSTFLVAESRVLAGNLRLGLPQHPVVTADLADWFCGRERCLLVWTASENDMPPEPMRQWAASFASAEGSWDAPRYYEATCTFFATQRVRLGTLLVERK
jgi:4-amino-4-deoxy-L-arabinose transferase-like glycosyltransferase